MLPSGGRHRSLLFYKLASLNYFFELNTFFNRQYRIYYDLLEETA